MEGKVERSARRKREGRDKDRRRNRNGKEKAGKRVRRQRRETARIGVGKDRIVVSFDQQKAG